MKAERPISVTEHLPTLAEARDVREKNNVLNKMFPRNHLETVLLSIGQRGIETDPNTFIRENGILTEIDTYVESVLAEGATLPEIIVMGFNNILDTIDTIRNEMDAVEVANELSARYQKQFKDSLIKSLALYKHEHTEDEYQNKLKETGEAHMILGGNGFIDRFYLNDPQTGLEQLLEESDLK